MSATRRTSSAGRTGSAAEAFAYDIQQFKVGELIGAKTVGAANNNKLLPIAALLSLRHHPTRVVRLLTAASVLVGLAFVASHIPLVLPDAPGAHQIAAVLPRGIAERALLTVDIALLAALAAAPRRAAR